MPRRPLACLLALAAATLAPAQNPPKPAPKAAPKAAKPKPTATPAEDLFVAPGFKVELIRSAGENEGSWINLCVEGPDKLLVGGQRSQPVQRVTLKNGAVASVAPVGLPVTEAMGMLKAFDSLYVMGAGPNGKYGLHRCFDRDGDGNYEEVKYLKDFKTGGEHGAHAIVPGPDGKIYVISGNFVGNPGDLSPTSPHRNYKEDLLLPRQWDGNGHAAGIVAPGGCVTRANPDGTGWELFCAGFRNAYDFAFNADGELFTFDSDMEWDWGMPWYRPTRVNHCVSGGESGWRSGTGVWPAHYPDSLPAVVNVGLGSPTGVCNGIGLKAPAKYQRALFLCDWTYGRLFAVHLSPDGAGYTGQVEQFVAPAGLVDGNKQKKPLNLTDAVVGTDGALYFTTGGRNTAGGLYRVTYTGNESTALPPEGPSAASGARLKRRELEKYHGAADAHAVSAAWPFLGDADRNLRHAARIAVEAQPVASWREKALAEPNARAALAALLSLARCDAPEVLPKLLESLARFPDKTLGRDDQLDKLRVLHVAFARLGRPSSAAAKKLLAEYDGAYPSSDPVRDREAVQLLVYLQSPTVVAKGLKQLAAATTVEDRMFLVFHLRTMPVGYWTLDQRKEYLAAYTADRSKLAHPAELTKWFAEAGRPYSDGNSFPKFLKNFAREHAAGMSPAELAALGKELAAIDAQAVVTVESKPRPFVKAWTVDELAPQLDAVGKGRNFDKGKAAFADAACAKCHRVGDWGGAVGPELTAISARFDRRALLESIVEPSKVVSDQYQNETFQLTDGRTLTGRVVDETPDEVAVQADPLAPERVRFRKGDVEARKPAALSPMPGHLIDGLQRDEVLDLLAFLEAGGAKSGKPFQK